MNEDDKVKEVVSFISVNNELKKRKRELNIAVLKGDKDEIEHKKAIFEKVKETRDSYIKRKV